MADRCTATYHFVQSYGWKGSGTSILLTSHVYVQEASMAQYCFASYDI